MGKFCYICDKCEKPILGPEISYRKGAHLLSAGEQVHYHKHCYHRMHPFEPKETLKQVLFNRETQDIVEELLTRLLPVPIQQQIIDGFNETMTSRHKELEKE